MYKKVLAEDTYIIDNGGDNSQLFNSERKLRICVDTVRE